MPWSAIFVVLTCFFTIPAELLMVRLAAGIEHGRVYANIGGVTISDPDCYVTVGVMFWFAYFSVVFFYSWDLHKEEETMVFKAHCISFPCTELLLFNYAKVKTVFHSTGTFNIKPKMCFNLSIYEDSMIFE